MTGLCRCAIVELLRRAVSLTLLVAAAVAGLAHGSAAGAMILTLTAIAVHVVLPLPALPDGALRADRFPTVHGPDLIAAMMMVPFFSLPFIIAASYGMPGVPWGLMLLLWPAGVAALAISVLAARARCSWVRPAPDGLELGGIGGRDWLPFAEMRAARLVQTRMPRWLVWALTLFGGMRGAGVALLHGNRRAHWLEIEMRDGRRKRVQRDAFDDVERVQAAIAAAGVPLEEEPSSP